LNYCFQAISKTNLVFEEGALGKFYLAIFTSLPLELPEHFDGQLGDVRTDAVVVAGKDDPEHQSEGLNE
jgi:hypothetical protein